MDRYLNMRAIKIPFGASKFLKRGIQIFSNRSNQMFFCGILPSVSVTEDFHRLLIFANHRSSSVEKPPKLSKAVLKLFPTVENFRGLLLRRVDL